MTNETISLRDACKVALKNESAMKSMQAKIRNSFVRRDKFESDNGLDLTANSSYAKAKKKILADGALNAVSAFFIARNVEPKNVIERQVVTNAMFNAKALEKLCEIAQYACGNTAKVQLVTRCFLACSIKATDAGNEIINNDINHRFLNNAAFGALITDQKLVEYINENRLKSMSSGALTQSSQVRNVLDVLGIGAIVQGDRARGAIKIDKNDSFVKLFRDMTFKKA